MKLDVVTGVVLIFCIGVFASALASSDLFSSSDSTSVISTQLDE